MEFSYRKCKIHLSWLIEIVEEKTRGKITDLQFKQCQRRPTQRNFKGEKRWRLYDAVRSASKRNNFARFPPSDITLLKLKALKHNSKTISSIKLNKLVQWRRMVC